MSRAFVSEDAADARADARILTDCMAGSTRTCRAEIGAVAGVAGCGFVRGNGNGLAAEAGGGQVTDNVLRVLEIIK